jgi:hypothetical protein
MQAREAKDILLNEIERQARLERIFFSDLERRLLYCTEEGDCPEDLDALDEGFESEHDAKEYEAKISGLARRAHQRLKNENSGSLRLWDEAVRVLKTEDHYLLVMLRMRRPHGAFSFRSFSITLGLGLLIGVVIIVAIIAADHYGIDLPEGHSNPNGVPRSGLHSQMPVWVQRSLLAAMVVIYVYGVAYRPINRFLAKSSQQVLGIFRSL